MERKEIKRYDFAALCNMLGSNNPDHAMLSDNVAMLMNGKKDKINIIVSIISFLCVWIQWRSGHLHVLSNKSWENSHTSWSVLCSNGC